MYNIYPLWPTADIITLNNNGDVVGGGGTWFYDSFTYSSFDGWLNDINDGDYAVGRGIGNIDAPVVVHNGVITDLSKLNGAEHAYEAHAINSKGLVCVGTELENGGLIIDIFNSKVEEVNFPNVSNPQPITINNDDDFAGTCVVNGDYSHGFWRHGQTCADLGPNLSD